MQELQKRLQPDTALTYNDVSDGNTMTDPEIRTKITSRDLSEMNNVNLQEDLQKVHVFSCIGDIPIVKTPVDTYDELRYTLYPISECQIGNHLPIFATYAIFPLRFGSKCDFSSGNFGGWFFGAREPPCFTLEVPNLLRNLPFIW